MTNTYPQALTIAGSDSDGSAGMQADLATFYARKVYGASILTAAVAGNSYGIQSSTLMPLDFIEQEFKSLAADFEIKASKTGMLGTKELIETVAKNYANFEFGPLVVDPVIMTKHGAQLLADDAVITLVEKLIPLATVLTPNYFEGQKLSGLELKSDQEIIEAAHMLQNLGAKNIVLKGRHDQAQQTEVRDYVLLADGSDFWMKHPMVETTHINGTGDSLSACIAAELAKRTPMKRAIEIAGDYVYHAINEQIDVAHKFGPVNHWVMDN